MSFIVFQDDAMVMLLYWRKCFVLVAERKFYEHVHDGEGVTTREDEGLNKGSERCYWMSVSSIQKIQYVKVNNNIEH